MIGRFQYLVLTRLVHCVEPFSKREGPQHDAHHNSNEDKNWPEVGVTSVIRLDTAHAIAAGSRAVVVLFAQPFRGGRGGG